MTLLARHDRTPCATAVAGVVDWPHGCFDTLRYKSFRVGTSIQWIVSLRLWKALAGVKPNSLAMRIMIQEVPSGSTWSSIAPRKASLFLFDGNCRRSASAMLE